MNSHYENLKNPPESSFFQIIKWIWNTLFHQIVAVITIYAIWIPIEHYRGTFSWHVILCTLGILPLMAESFILFSDHNVWSRELDKSGRGRLHVVLVCLSSVLIILGIALEIGRKSKYEEMVHFSSAHASMGLYSMIFIFAALILEILMNVSTIFRGIVPVWFKIGHSFFGQLAYITGLVCLILGFFTGWFTYYTSQTSRIAATVATVIIIIWSLFHTWKSLSTLIKSVLLCKTRASDIKNYRQKEYRISSYILNNTVTANGGLGYNPKSASRKRKITTREFFLYLLSAMILPTIYYILPLKNKFFDVKKE